MAWWHPCHWLLFVMLFYLVVLCHFGWSWVMSMRRLSTEHVELQPHATRAAHSPGVPLPSQLRHCPLKFSKRREQWQWRQRLQLSRRAALRSLHHSGATRSQKYARQHAPKRCDAEWKLHSAW
eukprot:TRINITY_DN1887_c0_g3_i1.p3 TRINITY_DN1887_c0_g3~~TRINITY_DN1887_c0_g3_i1.p3  ORF type:complete len:123 (-),score=14.21 TRINITY_DN1887_c0_g3_i1:1071-1439(-)